MGRCETKHQESCESCTAKENDCASAEKDSNRSRQKRSQGCTEETNLIKIKSRFTSPRVELRSPFDFEAERPLIASQYYLRPPFRPPFFRPPLSDLFTVAHARRSASLLLTPRFL